MKIRQKIIQLALSPFSQAIIVVFILFVGLSSCSKQRFEKQQFQVESAANEYTKPKVDIILVQDTSPSMQDPLEQLRSQFENFVNGLQNTWDFHFMVVNLHQTVDAANTLILAHDCSEIDSNYCYPADRSDVIADNAWFPLNGELNSNDPGFSNMQAQLQHSSMKSTGFLRDDASLAVIVFSNGEDGTGGPYLKDNGSGTMVPDPTSALSLSSITQFTTFFKIFKNSVLTHFYAVVADNNYLFGGCHSGNAYQGYRYTKAAEQTNGKFHNICSPSSMDNVLGQIKYELDSSIEAIVFNYAVFGKDEPNQIPNVDTLEVYKVDKYGNETKIEPYHPTTNPNGFSPVLGGDGKMQYFTNKNSAISPFVGSPKTGFFLQLHGTAMYKGTEWVKVFFRPH